MLIESAEVSLKEYAELMIFTQSGFKMSNQLGLSVKGKETKERIEKCMMKKKKHLLLGILIVFVISSYLFIQVKQTVKAQTKDEANQSIQLNKHHVEYNHDVHNEKFISVYVFIITNC